MLYSFSSVFFPPQDKRTDATCSVYSKVLLRCLFSVNKRYQQEMQKIKTTTLFRSKLLQDFILQTFKSLSTGVTYCFASRSAVVTIVNNEQILGGFAGLLRQSGHNKLRILKRGSDF